MEPKEAHQREDEMPITQPFILPPIIKGNFKSSNGKNILIFFVLFASTCVAEVSILSVRWGDCDAFTEMLEVPLFEGKGKYLRLLYLVGKSKREISTTSGREWKRRIDGGKRSF